MRKLPSVLLCAVVFLAASSCIKENRVDCPCYLVLDLSQIDASKFGNVEVDVQSTDGFLLSETVCPSDYPDGYVVEVPRRGVNVNVFSPEEGVEYDADRGFVVAEGTDFPRLWLHSSSLDTGRDMVRDTVRLHKSWCEMHITMLSDGSPCPFSIGVDGSVCGYSLSGEPEDGIFRVSLQPDGQGECSVRVPRQKDSSLGLSIVDDGDVLRRFALGEYIMLCGFDWREADLEDIDVTIDFSRTVISFKLRNWEKTWCYEIEI